MATPTADPGEVTLLLRSWRRGEAQALDRLAPLVYEDLRRLAGASMRDERRGHTLQPTALANEAFLRMVDVERIDWRDRGHFLAIAARSMRRVLVDHARRRRADKRRALAIASRLDDLVTEPEDEQAGTDVDVLALHEALEALAELDARQARIVELRSFGGLTIRETAEVLDLSTATVKVDWNLARAWLYRRLRGSGP